MRFNALQHRAGPPALAAGAVAATGFGALLSFSAAMTPSPHLRGLFDYTSATWGDGLLLPAMTGSLIFSIRSLDRAAHEAATAVVAGIIGTVAGATTQVMWLLNDSPQGNWTFPHPHHFNAAGWYHAGFLTLMSGASAAMWALALLRIARQPANGTPRSGPIAGVGVALVAAASFAVLLAIDSAGSPSTGANRATAGAVTAGAVVLAGALVATAARLSRMRGMPGTSPVRNTVKSHRR